jgi:arylsulfatase A-like enzyme
MYFNTAANVDRAVGNVLDRLRAALPEAPAVIVTADHGESLFDEDFLGHGYALNDVQTRVPFIVHGLPMTIDEPFGQSELRDQIAAALSAGGSGGPGPRLARPAGKVVFQYLGNINRPRQIGFVDGDARTIYDFRRQRVLLPGSSWRRPEQLGPDERLRFLELVHAWERMMLARSAR